MPDQHFCPKPTDPDLDKGAVEGDRPTDKQQGNENAVGALDSRACQRIAWRSRRCDWGQRGSDARVGN